MNKKGFTLAEILGVIVIISLLLLLLMPTIINKIAQNSEKAGSAGDNLIFTAADKYLEENTNIKKPGTYCIQVQELVDAGLLVKPVVDIKTGEDISDKTIYVVIDDEGKITHQIVEEDECKADTTLHNIRFIINPNNNKWVHERSVIIAYPKLGNAYTYEYKIDDGSWQSATEGNYTLPTFRKISTLYARVIGKESINNNVDIINIDNENPVINSLTVGPNSTINIKAIDQVSGIAWYYISKQNKTPNANDENWVNTNINPKTESSISIPKTQGTYYVWVKDKAGNISSGNNNSITLKNKVVTATFTKDKNVLSIDSASKSCTILAGNNSCQITLPNIVPNSKYIADGWYLDNTLAGKAKAKYKISDNVTLLAKAKEDIITIELSTTSKTNKITVIASATALSDIVKYEFSKDGGITFENGKENNIYTFNKLTQGTTYDIAVRVTSASGKQEIKHKNTKTTTIPLPTFKEQGTIPKTVTVTFPDGCGDEFTCTYQKNNEKEVEVKSKTADVQYTDDGTLVAKVSDGTNKVSSTYNVVMYIYATYHPESYTCPSGYTKTGSGSSTKCSKVSTTSANKVTKYTCPSGYTKTGSGSSTRCYKTKTETINATKKENKKCGSSCYLDHTGICQCSYSMQLYYKIECSNPEASKQAWRNYRNSYVNQGYNCECNVLAMTSQGYSGSGVECYKGANECVHSYDHYDAGNHCSRFWTENPSISITYTCPSGYTKTGSGSSTKCKKEEKEYVSANKSYTYTCPSGTTSSGSGSSMTCKKTITTSPTYHASYYTCPSGYTLSGNLCFPIK